MFILFGSLWWWSVCHFLARRSWLHNNHWELHLSSCMSVISDDLHICKIAIINTSNRSYGKPFIKLTRVRILCQLFQFPWPQKWHIKTTVWTVMYQVWNVDSIGTWKEESNCRNFRRHDMTRRYQSSWVMQLKSFQHIILQTSVSLYTLGLAKIRKPPHTTKTY